LLSYADFAAITLMLMLFFATMLMPIIFSHFALSSPRFDRYYAMPPLRRTIFYDDATRHALMSPLIPH